MQTLSPLLCFLTMRDPVLLKTGAEAQVVCDEEQAEPRRARQVSIKAVKSVRLYRSLESLSLQVTRTWMENPRAREEQKRPVVHRTATYGCIGCPLHKSTQLKQQVGGVTSAFHLATYQLCDLDQLAEPRVSPLIKWD